jgi:hypothetical protein
MIRGLVGSRYTAAFLLIFLLIFFFFFISSDYIYIIPLATRRFSGSLAFPRIIPGIYDRGRVTY